MSNRAAVERLHEDFQTLVTVLGTTEPSLRSTADDCFRKVLLLSAASFFERMVTETILAFVETAASKNECVTEFVRRKGLSRQYHTLFDWDHNNPVKGANKFFACFGDTFKVAVVKRISSDTTFEEAVAAFMEIGRDRNRLIHQDVATFSLEKTAQEIFEQYTRAMLFVEALPDLLASGGSPVATVTKPAGNDGERA